jgi:hypothetical protein
MLLKYLHSFCRSAVEWSRHKAWLSNSQTVTQRGGIFPRIGLSSVWNTKGEKFLDYWWNLIKNSVESSAPPLKVYSFSALHSEQEYRVSMSPAIGEKNTKNSLFIFQVFLPICLNWRIWDRNRISTCSEFWVSNKVNVFFLGCGIPKSSQRT